MQTKRVLVTPQWRRRSSGCGLFEPLRRRLGLVPSRLMAGAVHDLQAGGPETGRPGGVRGRVEVGGGRAERQPDGQVEGRQVLLAVAYQSDSAPAWPVASAVTPSGDVGRGASTVAMGCCIGSPLGCGCPLAGLAGADPGLGPLRLGGLLGLDFGGGVVRPGVACPLLTWARDATSTRPDQLDGLLGRDGLPGL